MEEDIVKEECFELFADIETDSSQWEKEENDRDIFEFCRIKTEECPYTDTEPVIDIVEPVVNTTVTFNPLYPGEFESEEELNITEYTCTNKTLMTNVVEPEINSADSNPLYSGEIKSEEELNITEFPDTDTAHMVNVIKPETNTTVISDSLYPGEMKSEEELNITDVEDNDDSEHLNSLTTASSHPQEISPVTVSELLQLNLSQLSVLERIKIKERGRSMPDILLVQFGISNNKKYIRSFDTQWYQRKSWLCGCKVRNGLFCFPCLIFGGDVIWTKEGFKDVNKVRYKIENHEKTKRHVENVISMLLLENVNTKEKISETYKLSINEHNVKVKKNREILSKVIDCFFFCGNFEKLFCGHDGNTDTINVDIFRELLNFASKLDPDLKNHLESATAFKGAAETIQYELLDCLLQIYHEEVKKEIREASFVAVMVDDVSDVSEHVQMVIVVRYVLNGEIFERFWGYFSPTNQTADSISRCILKQLGILLEGQEEKLIAQTFDVVNIMKDKKSVIQTKIKAVYSNTHFVHCYAHQLNSILRNASTSQNARLFFSNFLAIPTYFSRSAQRISMLKKHVDLSNPHISPTNCNFDVWTVNTVYENLPSLKSCLTEIQATSKVDQTVVETTGLLKFMNDDNFMFWLELTHSIIPHVEVIYSIMQSEEISLLNINEYITNFINAILDLKNSKYCENPSKILSAEAKYVCDCLCNDIKDRYADINHLFAAKLFDKKCFYRYMNEFPTEEVIFTVTSYQMISLYGLETELKILYCRSDLHGYCKLNELLKFILENDLDCVLSEITKLIKILLTIPMTTSEPGRCFSTLEKIKTFLRRVSDMTAERLNAYTVLSMEKDFLNAHPEIKDKIINLFAQSNTRRNDFVLN